MFPGKLENEEGAPPPGTEALPGVSGIVNFGER